MSRTHGENAFDGGECSVLIQFKSVAREIRDADHDGERGFNAFGATRLVALKP